MLALCCVAERPKKLRKLAGKLNIKKSRCLDYKAEQERHIGEPAYQPLLPPQVNGESDSEISLYHILIISLIPGDTEDLREMETVNNN